MAEELIIRRTTREESDEVIWGICQELLNDGTTYIFRADATHEELLDYWFPTPGETHVATLDNRTVGCYLLRPTHGGRGSHVANASYFVETQSRRSGVGRKMAEHSLGAARKAGYRAMQFNLVVATNHGAIALWKDLRFETIGTVPQAFDHKELGLTDALIMHRTL